MCEPSRHFDYLMAGVAAGSLITVGLLGLLFALVVSAVGTHARKWLSGV